MAKIYPSDKEMSPIEKKQFRMFMKFKLSFYLSLGVIIFLI